MGKEDLEAGAFMKLADSEVVGIMVELDVV